MPDALDSLEREVVADGRTVLSEFHRDRQPDVPETDHGDGLQSLNAFGPPLGSQRYVGIFKYFGHRMVIIAIDAPFWLQGVKVP